MAELIPYTTDYSGRQVDIELLQSISKPVIIEQVSISTVTKPAKIVAGIEKLVQRYANLILSVIGDTHFDVNNGAELMKLILGNQIQNQGRLQNAFASSNVQVIRQLQIDDEQEEVYGTQPDDEKIDRAELLDSSVDYATSTIYLRIQLYTLAGDEVVFVVPATAPR
jgi:hypothetical protein